MRTGCTWTLEHSVAHHLPSTPIACLVRDGTTTRSYIQLFVSPLKPQVPPNASYARFCLGCPVGRRCLCQSQVQLQTATGRTGFKIVRFPQNLRPVHGREWNLHLPRSAKSGGPPWSRLLLYACVSPWSWRSRPHQSSDGCELAAKPGCCQPFQWIKWHLTPYRTGQRNAQSICVYGAFSVALGRPARELPSTSVVEPLAHTQETQGVRLPGLTQKSSTEGCYRCRRAVSMEHCVKGRIPGTEFHTAWYGCLVSAFFTNSSWSREIMGFRQQRRGAKQSPGPRFGCHSCTSPHAQ